MSARKRIARVLLGLAIAAAATFGALAVGAAWQRTHAPRVVIHYHQMTTRPIAFVDDGEKLAFLDEERDELRVQLHSTRTGKWLGRLITKNSANVWGVGGPFIAFGSTFGVEVFSLETGSKTATLMLGWPSMLSVSFSGRLVALSPSSGGKPVELRSTRDGSLVSTLDVTSDVDFGSHLVRFSPRENTYASGSSPRGVVGSTSGGKTVHLGARWFVGFTATGDVIGEFDGSHGGPMLFVHSSQDGRLLRNLGSGYRWAEPSDSGESLALVYEHWIDVIRPDTGEVRRRVAAELPQRYQPQPVLLSPKGDLLAVSFDDGRVEVWEIP